MTPVLHVIEARCPHGADVLREQLRWANAAGHKLIAAVHPFAA